MTLRLAPACALIAGVGAAMTAPWPAPVPEESLLVLLRESIPPILHYRTGIGPLTRGHYGVLVGWDPERREYLVNDGRDRTARYRHDDLMRRWKAAGSLALIVGRPVP